MLGYVKAVKSELKMWEYQRYAGYYCGICKSIGARYGQLPRMALSYDAVFLALLLSGLSPDEDIPVREACLIHPIRKRPVLSGTAIDYAADVMLILAWYKLMDDIRDEGRMYARVAVVFMRGIFRKLVDRHAVLCRKIEEYLTQLSALEEAECASLDQAAEPFARIMEAVLTEAPLPEDFHERAPLSGIGYHLGKWIYLMDAMDDLAENIRTGVYNPLVYRFGYEQGETGFRERIMELCRFNLFHYLAEIARAVELLPVQKNQGIIDNIIYPGLYRRTEQQMHMGETL